MAVMDDSFIIYVVLLALVGLFQLVKKLFERATTGEDGKKIDIAQAVQQRIRKYMREQDRRDTGPMPTVSSLFETPAPEAPPVEVTLAPPPVLVRPRPAKPAVVAPRRHRTRRLVDATATLSVRTAAVQGRKAAVARFQLTLGNLKASVILAELLGPPVGERKNFRLF